MDEVIHVRAVRRGPRRLSDALTGLAPLAAIAGTVWVLAGPPHFDHAWHAVVIGATALWSAVGDRRAQRAAPPAPAHAVVVREAPPGAGWRARDVAGEALVGLFVAAMFTALGGVWDGVGPWLAVWIIAALSIAALLSGLLPRDEHAALVEVIEPDEGAPRYFTVTAGMLDAADSRRHAEAALGR